MKVRDLRPNEIGICAQIVRGEWGEDAAKRASAQMSMMFDRGILDPNALPHFLVAADEEGVHGFAGFRPSWIMNGAYELIWVAVSPSKRKQGIGPWLTERRLAEIEERGGKFVTLMTQHVEFFERFGFAVIDTVGAYRLMIKRLEGADSIGI